MEIVEESCARLANRVSSIVGEVYETLLSESGEAYDIKLVEHGIRVALARRLEELEDDLLDTFTTPGTKEFDSLISIVEREAPKWRELRRVQQTVHTAEEFNDPGLIEGFKPFSKVKIAAMIEYLTSKGQNVYKTSLNKLLFYSDLTHFYLNGVGMSGAVYVNRPFGPVADPVEPILNELIEQNIIEVDARLKTLRAVEKPPVDALNSEERKLLDWVAETYGEMTAREISGLSHREMAYRYTEPNEPIAYAYGKFFKHLPPKDLLAE